MNICRAPLRLDEAAPFFIADGLRQALAGLNIVNGMVVTAACRMHKSDNEIAFDASGEEHHTGSAQARRAFCVKAFLRSRLLSSIKRISPWRQQFDLLYCEFRFATRFRTT